MVAYPDNLCYFNKPFELNLLLRVQAFHSHENIDLCGAPDIGRLVPNLSNVSGFYDFMSKQNGRLLRMGEDTSV